MHARRVPNCVPNLAFQVRPSGGGRQRTPFSSILVTVFIVLRSGTVRGGFVFETTLLHMCSEV
jgi:hypothetical protein